MATTDDLYTTVVNTSGATRTFSYLSKHGKELAADEQYSVWGHIQHSFGHGEVLHRKKRALEKDLTLGRLTIKSTPKPVYYTAKDTYSASVATATVALTTNVVTVTCATAHKLVKAQYVTALKELTSNIAKITLAGAHNVKVGDKVIVALTTPDAVFDGCQLVTAVEGNDIYFAKTNANVSSAAAAGTLKVIPRYVLLAGVTDESATAAVLALNGYQEVTGVTSATAFTFAKTASNISSVSTTAGTVDTKVVPDPVATLTVDGNVAGTASGFTAKYFGFAITYTNEYGETTMGSSPTGATVTADKVVAVTLPILPPGCKANVYMTGEYADSTAYTAAAAASTPSLWKAVAIGVSNNTNPLATTNVLHLTNYSYYDAATFADATISPPATNSTAPSALKTISVAHDGSLGTVDLSMGKSVTKLS